MAGIEEEIGTAVQEIVDKQRGKRYPIMSGKVVAGTLDDSAKTVSVVLSINDEESPTQGVLLNAVTLNSNGLLLYPADGSNVWVAEVDGKGKYGIIHCSNLLKMVITIGGIKLTIQDGEAYYDEGSFGGIPKIVPLVSKINALEILFNNLKTAVTAALTPGSVGDGAVVKAAILTGLGAGITSLTMQSDLENTKVKH